MLQTTLYTLFFELHYQYVPYFIFVLKIYMHCVFFWYIWCYITNWFCFIFLSLLYWNICLLYKEQSAAMHWTLQGPVCHVCPSALWPSWRLSWVFHFTSIRLIPSDQLVSKAIEVLYGKELQRLGAVDTKVF